jgi:hypothetical protein
MSTNGWEALRRHWEAALVLGVELGVIFAVAYVTFWLLCWLARLSILAMAWLLSNEPWILGMVLGALLFTIVYVGRRA